MIIIPIGLDESIIKKVDLLVKQEKFKNRADGLRHLIIKGLQKIEVIDLPPLNEVENQIVEELLKSKNSLTLKFNKPICEIIADSRE
jgi:Arc/MetJ-type ribon-helix-helix transcriptional regulator